MTSPGSLDSTKARSPLVSLFQSPIGKKLISGLSGLGLVAFVLIHMAGNLLLLISRDRFNRYALTLEHLKPFIVSIEVVLLLLVTIHAAVGIQLYWTRRQARPVSYSSYQSAGAPSHQNWSSRNMILTGVGLGGFLVWHLWTFKYGPVYTTLLDGESARDLAQIVIETFQQPLYTVSYGLILGGLLLHLRHGLWSALQSIGVLFSGQYPQLYWICNGVALVLFVGFMSLPTLILSGWIH